MHTGNFKKLLPIALLTHVLIKFLDKINDDIDNELNYLQDILNLSGSNWRGFNAKSMPISIYY